MDNVLEEHARTYHRILLSQGDDSEQLDAEFEKLKTLVQVEIYFLDSVRRIVSDEEMSGFLLYISDKQLRQLFNTYEPSQGCFSKYLSYAMKHRAFDYRAKLTRDKRLQVSYILNYLPYEYDNHLSVVAETPAPYEVFEEEPQTQEITVKDKLRYICATKPLTQKRLFISLCVYLPFLSPEQIDRYCEALNFNRDQTHKLALLLGNVCEKRQARRTEKRRYYQARKDFSWKMTMELETQIHAYSLIDPLDPRISVLERRLKYHQNRLYSMQDNRDEPKLRIEYPILGEVLNVGSNYISAAVFSTKKVLEYLVNGQGSDSSSYILKILEQADSKSLKTAKLKDFRPYEVFRITQVS